MEALEKGESSDNLGDTLKALSSKIPDNSVDLIFADPPYNIGKNFNGRQDKWISEEAYLEWCYKWIDLCLRKLKDKGSFYLMAATQKCPFLTSIFGTKSASFLVLFGPMIVRGSKPRNITVLYMNPSFFV